MTTLFDINDTIKFTVIGTIKSFSASKDGDCYIISIKDGKNEIPIYLDTRSLILSNATKIIKTPQEVLS